MRYKYYTEETYNDYIARLYGNNKRVEQISFQVTENCCMKCTYCYQHNKSTKTMNFEQAKNFIDKLFNDEYIFITKEKTRGLILEFIGGEPFLEIDLITQIIDYYFEQAILKNHPWLYNTCISICSNGLLYFNDKVQSLFQKYSDLISFTISIDGNKELHDKCRIDAEGKGTYDRALKAVQHYRKTYNKTMGSKMTLSPENISYLYDSIISLYQNGYHHIMGNCVFEDVWELSHAHILYNELIKIADYLIDNNLYNDFQFDMFQEDIGIPMSENDNDNCCGGTLRYKCNGLAINPEGDFYLCLRYMPSSLNNKQIPLNIGSINNGIGSNETEQQNITLLSNITRRTQSSDECFYCPVASGCRWCSGYNYEVFGTPNKRTTFICWMHKARVLANVYYWNKLYKKLNINKEYINYLSQNDIEKILKGE